MSILEKEILQQPEVIKRLLEMETNHVADLVKRLIGRFDYIMIAARGTSDNAARYAQYLFGARNRIPVGLATPSLFTLYKSPPSLNGALVIAISQSGQSPDIIEVIAEGKRQGRPTLAIVNHHDSPLANLADHVILLHAETEQAVAATKTYIASLAAMALLSTALMNDQQAYSELCKIPDWIEHTFDLVAPTLNRVERYRYMTHCAVIGRGYNYSTAFEIALKIKELTQTIAEPYSSADFRHGPIAMVRNGFPVVLVAPLGYVHSDLQDLVQELRSLDSELLIISDDQYLLNHAHFSLPIPAGIPEWLSPLVTVIPGQLFSLRLAISKGLDPNQPEGLTKVTKTL